MLVIFIGCWFNGVPPRICFCCGSLPPGLAGSWILLCVVGGTQGGRNKNQNHTIRPDVSWILNSQFQLSFPNYYMLYDSLPLGKSMGWSNWKGFSQWISIVILILVMGFKCPRKLFASLLQFWTCEISRKSSWNIFQYILTLTANL